MAWHMSIGISHFGHKKCGPSRAGRRMRPSVPQNRRCLRLSAAVPNGLPSVRTGMGEGSPEVRTIYEVDVSSMFCYVLLCSVQCAIAVTMHAIACRLHAGFTRSGDFGSVRQLIVRNRDLGLAPRSARGRAGRGQYRAFARRLHAVACRFHAVACKVHEKARTAEIGPSNRAKSPKNRKRPGSTRAITRWCSVENSAPPLLSPEARAASRRSRGAPVGWLRAGPERIPQRAATARHPDRR